MKNRIPPLDTITAETVASWFYLLAELGLDFHPEDDPATVTNGTREATFTGEECAQLRATLDAISNALPDIDLCAIALDAATASDTARDENSAYGGRTFGV